MVILDWTARGPEGPGSVGPPAPCIFGDGLTELRSPRGVACHKTCAEAWVAERVERVAEYEQMVLDGYAGRGAERVDQGVAADVDDDQDQDELEL